jgi:SAM-dependent methyltransferase
MKLRIVKDSATRRPVVRLLWPLLRVVDLAMNASLRIAAVPLHVRRRWVAPGTVLRNRRGADALMALLGDTGDFRVLDVGGGMAALAASLTPGRRGQLVTLDLDFALLKRVARERSGLVCADGTRLPFADQTFDAVIMVHALEHIPEGIRDRLAQEIARVSRRGVVIHGPAGPGALQLSHQFIAALQRRGLNVPRYAREHLEMGLPMPEWFTRLFPGCELTPRRNLDVELRVLLTEYTPVARWFAGYRNERLAAVDDRPPFVEYTMTWKRPAAAEPVIAPPFAE